MLVKSDSESGEIFKLKLPQGFAAPNLVPGGGPKKSHLQAVRSIVLGLGLRGIIDIDQASTPRVIPLHYKLHPGHLGHIFVTMPVSSLTARSR